MDSRWYLKRGQTLENTKIEDRGHALHVSKSAWEKIQKHLYRNQEIAEAQEKEIAYRKRMKEGSYNMTKNWDNSVENIRLRKDEERQQRNEVKEDTKMKNYLKLRAYQDSIREKYVDDKRKEAYRNTQYPKELNGALLTSEVIHEREKQLEFQEFIKNREAELEKEMAERIKIAAEEEVLENQAKLVKERQKQVKFAKAAKKQMQQQAEEKEAEIQQQIAIDAENNIKAAEELAEYDKIQLENKHRLKQELNDGLKNSIEIFRRRKEYIAKEEQELDDVIKVFSNAKDRIECLRKQRVKELRDQEILKRIKAAEGVFVAQKAKDEGLQALIEKVTAEKYQKETEIEAEKQRIIAENTKQRKADYEAHLIEDEKRKELLEEKNRWDMLNRLKASEVMKEYDKQVRKDDQEKKKAYRAVLDEQKRITDEENLKGDLSKEHARIEQIKSLKVEDDRFFEYANEVLDLAKSRGRLTYPIEKVINKYRKEALGEIATDNRRCHEDTDDGSLLIKTPGQRQHDPRSDPVYCRCKCQKERLYR